MTNNKSFLVTRIPNRNRSKACEAQNEGSFYRPSYMAQGRVFYTDSPIAVTPGQEFRFPRSATKTLTDATEFCKNHLQGGLDAKEREIAQIACTVVGSMLTLVVIAYLFS